MTEATRKTTMAAQRCHSSGRPAQRFSHIDRKEHEERDKQYPSNRDLIGQGHNEDSVWWKGSFTAKISGSTFVVVQDFKWVALSVLAIWVVAICMPSVRDSYANGWRCMLRYASLWKLPGGFALAYGLFQILDFLLLHWRIGRVPELAPLLARMPLDSRQIALDSMLPAAELLAAALNCLVATFPISVVCGFLFLANYRGLTGELGYALLRRYRIWGWVWLGLLAACALAAVGKPLTLLTLPELATVLSLHELLIVCSVVNGLSFAFEYLLGTCLQVYLLLITYGWVRGLHFRRARVLQLAVRRMGFVLNWAVVIVIATLALIHLPLFVEAWITGDPIGWQTLVLVEMISRPTLAAITLALATVQIRLILHNDSLRGAMAAHGRFLEDHGLRCLASSWRASLCFTCSAHQTGGNARPGAAPGAVLAAADVVDAAAAAHVSHQTFSLVPR